MLLEQDVINLNSDGDVFYTIQNADGKKWSFNANNLQMSFEIYEPSSVKGKLLKTFYFLLRFNILRNILGIKKQKLVLNPKLSRCISELVGENIYFSIFYGTPSTDQKITIQFFNKEEILCYCKMGESERVGVLFDKETKLITYLKKKGIKHIPDVLYNGIVNNNFVFMQSTEKIVGAKILHEMGDCHKLFLENLYKSTVNDIAYEATQYYELINSSYDSFDMLSIDRQRTIIDAKNMINQKYRHKVVSWGVVHGDFTPWNTCQVNKDIFVFDFEYGLLNAPSEIDYWHFIIQTLIYEKKMPINIIAKLIVEKTKNGELTIEGFQEYILFYVSTYLRRGEDDDVDQICVRIDLLGMVNKFI